MGKQNSSQTRVEPVFNRLIDSDSTGTSWLPRLLRLGSRAETAAIPANIGVLAPTHKHWWGRNERRLPPSQKLLKWLVTHIDEAAVNRSGDEGNIRDKRLLLARGDNKTTAEALGLIQAGKRGRLWHNLEGESAPDAFVETDQIILVVEGKRTERSCTSKTKWMPRRSQLLRHMDAAFEVRQDRRVLGLLIVEGADNPPGDEASSYWKAQADEQVSEKMLADSLPHRSPEERATIASGVLGVATWERVCSEFGIAWPPVTDEP